VRMGKKSYQVERKATLPGLSEKGGKGSGLGRKALGGALVLNRRSYCKTGGITLTLKKARKERPQNEKGCVGALEGSQTGGDHRKPLVQKNF